jgi:cysteinyl-tRNA synthetase
MSKRYLGDTLDIHAGGVDLMFPHHENEIAQSEAANHEQFARVWLHSEFLSDATGEKMSKSAGGFTTLRDLLAAGHDPLAIRFFLIANAHYRSKLRMDDAAIHAAAEQVRRLQEFAARVHQFTPSDADDARLVARVEEVRAAYRASLDDDFNLPQGIGHVFDLLREANAAMDRGEVGEKGRLALQGLLSDVDRHLDILSPAEAELDEESKRLLREREEARSRRDFARSDALREELNRRGILIEDTKEGVRWRRA